MHEFFHDVILHSLKEALLLLPFLFATYLLMEWIEHRASDKALSLLHGSGRLAPPIGALFGIVPQCGFSAMASNLYASRAITMGTLIAVLLSTSDEMLPLLIGSGAGALTILSILFYKVVVAILIGLLTDALLPLLERRFPALRVEHPHKGEEKKAPTVCGCEACHQATLLRAALLHTAHIGLFVLACVTFVNLLLFLIGEDALAALLTGAPVLSHVLCALIGLIPNCAASVLLCELYLSGVLSAGAMLAGLLPGAGVGILVLCRTNRSWRETGVILGILVLSGILFGLLADAPFLSPIFAL